MMYMTMRDPELDGNLCNVCEKPYEQNPGAYQRSDGEWANYAMNTIFYTRTAPCHHRLCNRCIDTYDLTHSRSPAIRLSSTDHVDIVYECAKGKCRSFSCPCSPDSQTPCLSKWVFNGPCKCFGTTFSLSPAEGGMWAMGNKLSDGNQTRARVCTDPDRLATM